MIPEGHSIEDIKTRERIIRDFYREWKEKTISTKVQPFVEGIHQHQNGFNCRDQRTRRQKLLVNSCSITIGFDFDRSQKSIRQETKTWKCKPETIRAHYDNGI